MWLYAAVGAALVAGVLLVARWRVRRRWRSTVAALLEEGRARTAVVDFETDLAGLPAPVRRYFETVLRDGQPRISTARIEQHGEIRLGDDAASWHPFDATEWFTVDPPGFVWDATVRVAPLLSVRVLDRYREGRGGLEARLVSLVPVADAEPGPLLDEGELVRYLAEAVWLPTALLPDAGVTWRGIDDETAEATLVDGETTATLTVHVNDRGLIDRVHAAARPREVDGEHVPTPWTGTFEEYGERDGMLVPTRGSVGWDLPDGHRPYWRGTVRSVAYSAGAGSGQTKSPRST